jgi:hypothetical protein
MIKLKIKERDEIIGRRNKKSVAIPKRLMK